MAGHSKIWTHIIKFFYSSIVKPLSIIFSNSFNSGMFPGHWKRLNIVPAHKQLIKNYFPVWLLPISSKIFQKLIFNQLHIFVEESGLFCSNQSRFRKTDSCVNQHLSIVQKIYYLLMDNLLITCHLWKCAPNFWISKAFDRVWHEGLVYKLKTIGVSDNFLILFQSFLDNRHQRVLFHGQNFLWDLVKVGLLQAPILGPLLFLTYINDLPNNLI